MPEIRNGVESDTKALQHYLFTIPQTDHSLALRAAEMK